MSNHHNIGNSHDDESFLTFYYDCHFALHDYYSTLSCLVIYIYSKSSTYGCQKFENSRQLC